MKHANLKHDNERTLTELSIITVKPIKHIQPGIWTIVEAAFADIGMATIAAVEAAFACASKALRTSVCTK